LNFSPRWLWLCAALIALIWWQYAHRPRTHPKGVLIADVPLQGGIEGTPAQLSKYGITLKPLATFSLSARVLGRADYHWDFGAKLIPVDLALGWGRMSDSAVLEKLDISQSARYFYWSTKQPLPIPAQEIVESAANMHLIPADEYVERAIKRTRVGDIAKFDGLLVEAQWPNGTKWTSSLTRSDSGSGACELVWVQHFDTASR